MSKSKETSDKPDTLAQLGVEAKVSCHHGRAVGQAGSLRPPWAYFPLNSVTPTGAEGDPPCGAPLHGHNVDSFRAGRTEVSSTHPTAKAVGSIPDEIEDRSCRNDIVMAPFQGCRSTLIGCQKTGRQAWLIKIVPLYLDTS